VRSLAIVFFSSSILLFASSASAGDGPLTLGSIDTFATATKLDTQVLNSDRAPRDLVGAGLRMPTLVSLVGASAALAITQGPMRGRIFEARYSSTIDSFDGTSTISRVPMSLHTDGVHVAEFGWAVPVPGLQVQLDNDWSGKLTGDFVWGVSYTWSQITVTGPSSLTGSGTASKLDGWARIDLGICKRVPFGSSKDHNEYSAFGCVVAQPYIYSHGWFPGGSVALRVEL